MLAMGRDDESLERAIAEVRGRIAFYGCTVAYRPVLELHGWGGLQDELIPLNRAHRTEEMAALITEEMVQTFAIIGTPEEVVETMGARFGGVITRTGFGGAGLEPDELAGLLSLLRACHVR
jgi:alkanesulfonate monooxygenase SsuD/methylene tetrahydromethanopterin reductase-like flavin-dependent oxidoreductase (luciferase family)